MRVGIEPVLPPGPPLTSPISLSCDLCPYCFRMEESTPHSSSWSRSVLVLSPAALLVKRSQYEELVLPSLLPPGWRRREGEELVCGTTSLLTGRQNTLTQAVSVWSEEGEEQGGGRSREGQHSLPFKVELSVCSGPHLEVDSEVEPKTVAIQETGQTF